MHYILLHITTCITYCDKRDRKLEVATNIRFIREHLNITLLT
jgi:hypothetical protein